MASTTGIQWTDSTFNPAIGCTKAGPGCDHCYAEADMDKRRHRVKWGAGNPRSRTSEAYWKQPLKWNAEKFWQCLDCGWRGSWKTVDSCLSGCPGCGGNNHATARRRVFCASLADWLDNEWPIEWLVDLLDLIRRTPNLDWQLLTKRIGNWRTRLVAAHDYAVAAGLPDELPVWIDWWVAGLDVPKNVWLGATVVNQAEANRDILKLLHVPARVRFLSIEPQLGKIDLSEWLNLYQYEDGDVWHERNLGLRDPIGWVISGFESGTQARPGHPEWLRLTRDQCAAARVPWMFKQWGEWAPFPCRTMLENKREGQLIEFEHESKERFFLAMPLCCEDGPGNCETMHKVGKKAAGRLLDGVEHNGFPESPK